MLKNVLIPRIFECFIMCQSLTYTLSIAVNKTKAQLSWTSHSDRRWGSQAKNN